MTTTRFVGILGICLGLVSLSVQIPAATLIDLDDPAHTALASIILGESRNDWLGDSMHLADLNGDGEMDLILGAYKHSSPNGARSGRVYILYGPVAGVTEPATIDLKNISGDYLILDGDAAEEVFGYSITTGDLNNDGVPDLIVSAPLGTYNRMSRSGKVYIFFGKPGQKIISNETGPLTASDVADCILHGAGAADAVGMEMICADFTRDGTDDLIITAPFGTEEDVFANRAYVFSGIQEPTEQLTFSLATDYTFLILNLPYNNSANLNNSGLAFGYLTDATDTPCLAFATKGANVGSLKRAGMILGVNARPTSATMTIEQRWIDINKDKLAFKIKGTNSYAEAGEVIRAVSLDDNAAIDALIIGSSGGDPALAATIDDFWGTAYILYTPIPFGADFALNQLGASGPVPALGYKKFTGVGGYDIAVSRVPVGSLTETLYAISNPIASSTPEREQYAGRIHLFYGASIAGVTDVDVTKKKPDVLITGAYKHDEMGRSILFGNVGLGGTPALIVGASFMDPEVPGDTDPRYDAGQIFVLPMGMLSPVPGDSNADQYLNYRDVFHHSLLWSGNMDWRILDNWEQRSSVPSR